MTFVCKDDIRLQNTNPVVQLQRKCDTVTKVEDNCICKHLSAIWVLVLQPAVTEN